MSLDDLCVRLSWSELLFLCFAFATFIPLCNVYAWLPPCTYCRKPLSQDGEDRATSSLSSDKQAGLNGGHAERAFSQLNLQVEPQSTEPRYRSLSSVYPAYLLPQSTYACTWDPCSTLSLYTLSLAIAVSGRALCGDRKAIGQKKRTRTRSDNHELADLDSTAHFHTDTTVTYSLWRSSNYTAISSNSLSRESNTLCKA